MKKRFTTLFEYVNQVKTNSHKNMQGTGNQVCCVPVCVNVYVGGCICVAGQITKRQWDRVEFVTQGNL